MGTKGYLPPHMATMPVGCPSSRHADEDDNWDWNPFGAKPVKVDYTFPPGATFTPDRPATLTAARRLLELDGNAATIVAATVSTVQSTRESRSAFVKRIVKAWIDEMERGE